MHHLLNYKKATISYRVIGKGSPVVLIHGFGEDSQIWESQIALLKDKFQLIIPDLPGSGQSQHHSDAREDWSMDFFADCIKAILEKENPDNNPSVIDRHSGFILIGHSMGGYISLAFAEKFPEWIRAFGLYHSSAFADSEEKKEARKKSIAFIEANGSAPFIGQATPALFSDGFRSQKPDIVAEITHKYSNFSARSLVHYLEGMMDRPDRTSILKNFNGPILFIMGVFDKAVPLEQGLQQCHLPALSYIQILENAAHMGMIEEISLANPFLEKFLQEIEIIER